MRVFMMTDLEGPCGVNGRPGQGVGNQIINPETAKQALVNEVNACVEGLVAAGADSVTVVDGHGGSNSIDIFKLHPAVELVQYGGTFYWGAPECKYDAAVQIGAHAMQNSGGFMCHSFNSHGISEIRLNGQPIGEIGVEVLIAAWFGFPMILVSGDEAACAEARAFIGDKVETVATKQAYNRYSARNYSPTKVYEELREKSKRALENRKKIPIVKIPKKLEMVYELMCPNTADIMEAGGAERIDFRTVRYTGTDFMDVWLGHGKTANAVEAHYGRFLAMKGKEA
ncbi:MAG: M55 family metallopeptidase [Victivallales bacterium]|nr:M55 family metallopeptidase [Victivallales bacterium]